MNEILALQAMEQAGFEAEELGLITGMTSHISIFSQCSSALDCVLTGH